MKKTALLLCTAALVCTMNIPVFAAQTKAEYKNETAQVRQELESTGNAIKTLQKENKEASSSCNTLRKEQKEAGTLKEHKDTWKQVRELKDSIAGIQVSYAEASGQVKLLKAQAKQDVQEGRYDEAAARLNQALEQKKAALQYMEQINGVWDQIDQLIQ